MIYENRDLNGNFVSKYSTESFFEVLENNEVPVSTTEVAGKVGCSRRCAYDRLRELEKSGNVFSNKVGNSRKWSLGSTPPVEDRTLADYAAANLSRIPDTSAKGMVITIQQPHSRDILSGRKKIEFRRTAIRQENQPDIGFIYEPSPTQSIVGVFEVESVERRPVPELVEVGVDETPSTRDSLEEYFSGLDDGTAIHIKNAKPVDPPVPLHEEPTGSWRFNPPQSFYYVNPEEFINKFPQTKEESPPGESQLSGSSSTTS